MFVSSQQGVSAASIQNSAQFAENTFPNKVKLCVRKRVGKKLAKLEK
jgi:hypothetical protein